MNGFYHLAGRLIEHYRKEKQNELGNTFNVKQFCMENGRNICSFPTYKKIASGEAVNNEGFYYVLSNKLGVKFESFDHSDESFFESFTQHFCEVYESDNPRQIIYFCDFYESYFKNQKDFLVFRELWACLHLLKGIHKDFQNPYLDAIEAVVINEKFVSIIKSLRTKFKN